MTPNKGKPIPVNEKAMIAGQKAATILSKIRWKYQISCSKNIANKVKPIIQVFLFMLLLLLSVKLQ